MSIQKSDKEPVFDVIPMKDNEDEHVNDTHTTLTTVYIRPFLNLFSANAHLLMLPRLCRSHLILSKLIDIFDILFQTRVKMYLVPSLNWPLLYSSTMTMCASILALSNPGPSQAREEVILSLELSALSLLSALSTLTQLTANVASTLSSFLMPRTLNSCSVVETPRGGCHIPDDF